MTLVVAERPESWSAAHQLIKEYAASLQLDLSFQEFDRELAALADEYGPPTGHFVLACDESDGERFVGCGGFRRLSEALCEMKRLYVVPSHRGRGLGRIL